MLRSTHCCAHVDYWLLRYRDESRHGAIQVQDQQKRHRQQGEDDGSHDRRRTIRAKGIELGEPDAS